MCLLLINLYEFGQFLRILLWISVPMVVLSMLVTTWLHYRRKRRLPEELLLSLKGLERPGGLAIPALRLSVGEINGGGQERLPDGSAVPGEEAALEPEATDKIYKGILWMKEKYEQYRDLADRRYEQLREELALAEKKYEDLLESGVRPAAGSSTGQGSGAASEKTTGAEAAPGEAAPGDAAAEEDRTGQLSDIEKASYPDLLEEKNRQIAFLQQQLDQRIKNYHQAEFEGRENRNRMLELEETQLRTRYLLEEKQAYIDQLEGELVTERRKIEELVTKLQASSQQLLTIYEELDKSLKPANSPNEP